MGATDLLKSLSEVFELDLSVPIAQLANQVNHHPLHWHLHMPVCVSVEYARFPCCSSLNSNLEYSW